MTTPGMEELWDDVDEAAGCIANGPDCHPYKESWADLHNAVRACMKAVLEQATDYDTNHRVQHTQRVWWCCKYHMLIARIAALGQEK